MSADQSMRKVRAVVNDVLIQIDKFYYPIDLLILGEQFAVDANYRIPLILGQAFLSIANALISCRNYLIKLLFRNITLEVNIFHIGKQP